MLEFGGRTEFPVSQLYRVESRGPAMFPKWYHAVGAGIAMTVVLLLASCVPTVYLQPATPTPLPGRLIEHTTLAQGEGSECIFESGYDPYAMLARTQAEFDLMRARCGPEAAKELLGLPELNEPWESIVAVFTWSPDGCSAPPEITDVIETARDALTIYARTPRDVPTAACTAAVQTHYTFASIAWSNQDADEISVNLVPYPAYIPGPQVVVSPLPEPSPGRK